MSRPLRVEYPGAWYHVINRGRRKEEIYSSKKDYEEFKRTIKEAIEKFNLEVHAYSLMPNHYHLLIRTPEGNLSRIMRHIDGVYTQRYNKNNRKDGSLFKGRYKSIIVGGESYLLELIKYIHMNPVKAEIVKNPESHKWTSHREYLGKENEKWLKKELILNYFGKNRQKAIKQFDRYVKKRTNQRDLGLDKKRLPIILGEEGFKEKIKKILKGKKIDQKEVWSYKRVLQIDKTIDEIRKKIEFEFKIEDLSKIRRGINNYGKRVFIYTIKKHLKYTNQEIANYLGGIGYTAVSNQYMKACDDLSNKKGCSRYIKKIEKWL